jgi:hypothetical protein
MRLPLFFGTVAHAFEQERAMRGMFRLFKSIVAKEQKRAGISCCLWLEVLEGTPAVHSHVLFPLNGDAKRIALRMMTSERFPGDMLDIRRSNARAFVGYCSKERTPQAKICRYRKTREADAWIASFRRRRRRSR